MKGFMKEFKEFISRGNVMDMAVGIIIGSAFTAIVNALVNNIIMPLISVITGGISFDQWNITMGAGKDAPVLGLGTFIAAVINFLLIALVLFMVIKTINKMHEGADKLVGKQKEEEKPVTKICPYCKSEIPLEATRGPHCTSQLDKEEA